MLDGKLGSVKKAVQLIFPNDEGRIIVKAVVFILCSIIADNRQYMKLPESLHPAIIN